MLRTTGRMLGILVVCEVKGCIEKRVNVCELVIVKQTILTIKCQRDKHENRHANII
jgi:hypothetical protein